MKRDDIFLLSVLILVAFCLRFYDLSYPAFRWGDENGHVPAATNYWNNGQFEPDNWEHPPLRHLILYGFLQVFGDNPYGWRMRNVLFGASAAALTALFAFLVTGRRKAVWLAGLLMATDPLHVVLSRYTWEEVYGGAFFLAAIILSIKHRQRTGRILLSAFFLGCALATKWYYVPGWVLIWVLALREDDTYRNSGASLFLSSAYLFVPLSVFILSYYPWFGRGYSLNELAEFIVNAYHSLQNYQPSMYEPTMLFLSHASAAEWFIRPVVVGQGTLLGPDTGEFILYGNNIVVWCLTIPSLIGSAMLAIRKRYLLAAYPALFFCALYALYLIIKRPVFIYSAATLLPFAFTAIAHVIAELSDRYGIRIYAAAAAVLVCSNLFLYPLYTAKKVPLAPYRYFLEHADVKVL